MLIAGLQKMSLIDYPNKMTAIIFTVGCNFDCAYCHNKDLFKDKNIKDRLISEKEIFEFLNKRKNILEAVTITGGEPTLHKDLPDFINRIKKLGFLVKLDSNGTNPVMLKELVNKKLVDYAAVDIKAPFNNEKYKKIVQVDCSNFLKNISESVEFLLKDRIDFEFRTTLTKGLLTQGDIVDIVKKIKNNRIYYLQNFVFPEKQEFKNMDENGEVVYNKLKKLKPMENSDLEQLRNIIEKMGQKCEIRN
ncbi:MAG: anaerobic ribonucleoside-triphosphate reductase activating protein [Patescibacteria group bacterium]|nr:anaerobic ribonucleoside-triphosphate reductase activating protein [Patescibacteria group bacterium]